MRLHSFCLASVIAISCAASCFAQAPPLLGNVSVMPGQGANLTATVPILSGARLRFWADASAGLPPGVTMTPTFVEPGANHLTLHFEAIANAPLAANRLIVIYAGNSFSAVYQVNLSVIPATPPLCGAPSLNPVDQSVDQSTQSVLVSGVTPGCNVEVWTGNASGLEPVATSLIAAGVTSTRVTLPHRLSPGQVISVLQASGSTTTLLSGPIVVENNYVTNRYDNERSGWNPNETTLTTNSARYLRKICEHLVDGPIRAQPLYVQGVQISGRGKHNVVFVATDGDSVYAFDADSCIPNDTGLWVRKLLFDSTESVAGAGNVPAKCSLTYGIWSTPVIDRTTNTMYVVTSVGKGNNIFFRLHAIDIRTGQDVATPVVIDGTTVQFTHGNFTANLDPSVQQNRPGLLLDRGVVYLGFGSCGDVGSPYHGWVLAYDADVPGSPTFLKQLGVFNTSPEQNGSCNNGTASPPCMAGVWQSGLGLAADGDGTVYLLTGNGKFYPTDGSYGNTLLRLRLPPAGSTSNQMQVVSFFTPYDWGSTYEISDQDFGAGGPVLLSSEAPVPGTVTVYGSSGNGPKRFLLAGGKPHKSYLIDRDCVGCSGTPNHQCITATGQLQPCDDPTLVVQTISQMQGGIVAGPAYYTGPRDTRIFYGFNKLPMTAYNFQWGQVPPMTFAENAPDNAPSTSPIPAVSSNGGAPGTGVLWAVFNPDPLSASQVLTLHAYEAENLRDNLFSRSAQQSLDVGDWVTSGSGNLGNSFQVPTVIHGKVYAGSKDRLVVFAPVYPCIPVVDCNHGVAILCRRIPPELILQRKKAGAWITVTDPASTVDESFAYLFDYPGTENATYRVCFKNQPKSCMPEVTLKMKRARCTLSSLSPSCGVPGKPPCFLKRPWPVSPGHSEGGDESRDAQKPARKGLRFGKSAAPPGVAPE